MSGRVNFLGTVNTVKAAYASVTRQPGGRVVLVSSQAGQVSERDGKSWVGLGWVGDELTRPFRDARRFPST
jgi:NADP-dependent 3-hydroxy acid dehydrogenase YdfG